MTLLFYLHTIITIVIIIIIIIIAVIAELTNYIMTWNYNTNRNNM